MSQPSAGATPRSALDCGFWSGGPPSDDAEQPQDQDQDDNSAKTDIHDIPPVFVLSLKRWARESRSTRCGGASMLFGYHFTLSQQTGFA
jgi:hypothetical protein